MSERRSHNSANGDKQQINSPRVINSNQFPIIGIDLGISYWSAAIVQNSKTIIIPLFGKNNIPAFIACLNNEFKFGNEAKQVFFDNREVTIFDMLYILGLRFNSEGELEEHMNDYSYVVSSSSEKPKLSFPNRKSEISVEKLFDIIINNIIYTSEVFLNKTIHNIVVPIPVYFKESQKSALLRATSHVGIIELIFEPIATVYAYRIHEKYKDDLKDRYFLIYNLQEDNLDVSVVQYANNEFNIKSNLYERHLKKNYTFRYLDELCTQTYETYFISNPRFHPLNSGTLRYYCKTIFEDILYADCFEIEMDMVRDEKIIRTISREELDDLLRVLVQESLVLVENVLREANLNEQDIDEVLLVGQITRHTIVRQQLKYLFGRNSLNCSIDPEDVLVMGAALRADILQREIWANFVKTPTSNTCNVSPYSNISLNSISSHSEEAKEYNPIKKTATVCFKPNQQTELNENIRQYAGASICFEAGDVDKKQKQKIKHKLIKNDSIKKRKAKLSLRDKMLSMCTLFTDVVSGSNLKMSVKEKLLFVPSYLRNKLKPRSKKIKNDFDKDNIQELGRRDLCLELKNSTENIPNKNTENYVKHVEKPQEIITKQPNEQTSLKQNGIEDFTKPFNFQENVSMFDANKLKYILERSEKVSSKLKERHQVCFEKTYQPILEYDDEEFYNMLNSECVALNITPKVVKKQSQETINDSLKDKINCVKNHLDMYYVTVCFVVFVLHWASENICINIAIALISIAITLILNNRATIQSISSN